MTVEERYGELWTAPASGRHFVDIAVGTVARVVTIPRDVNDGRAIVAHDLDVLPTTVRAIAGALATAVAAGDWSSLGELLHDEVDFRGLTPARAWLAVGPEQVCAVLREWAAEERSPARLEQISVDTLTDRHRVGYRLAATGTESDAVCEHTVYFDLDAHARITFMRMLSSGARPSAAEATTR
jgi:hypothetical protein